MHDITGIIRGGRPTLQAWVLRGDKLWAVPLRVERTLYLDTDLQPRDVEAALPDVGRIARIKRTTPEGDAPPLLYQVAPAAQGPRHDHRSNACRQRWS